MLGILFFILILVFVVLPIVVIFSLLRLGKNVRNIFRHDDKKKAKKGNVTITHNEQRQRVNPNIGEYTDYEEIE